MPGLSDDASRFAKEVEVSGCTAVGKTGRHLLGVSPFSPQRRVHYRRRPGGIQVQTGCSDSRFSWIVANGHRGAARAGGREFRRACEGYREQVEDYARAVEQTGMGKVPARWLVFPEARKDVEVQ